MSGTASTEALFEPLDGGAVRALPYARGPWDPGALHGGPVAAILARAVEAAPTAGAPDSFDVARLTVELTRPAPMAPMVATAELVRPGRKVQLVDAVLRRLDDGREVARARALRIRRHPLELPDDPEVQPLLHPDPPLAVAPLAAPRKRSQWAAQDTAFHRDGVEHRFVDGDFDGPGPVTVWIRLAVPVVAGEEPTPLQRVAAAADFGNGVSHVLPFEDYTFINPDLTIHLARQPAGEWVALRAVTHPTGPGTGLAESVLYDEDGRIGRSVQSLVIERRG